MTNDDDLHTVLLAIRQAVRNQDEIALNSALVILSEQMFDSFYYYADSLLYDLTKQVQVSTIEKQAEDILNETLYKVYEKIDQYRGGTASQATAWLRKIIANQALSSRRKAERQNSIWGSLLMLLPDWVKKYDINDKGNEE